MSLRSCRRVSFAALTLLAACSGSVEPDPAGPGAGGNGGSSGATNAVAGSAGSSSSSSAGASTSGVSGAGGQAQTAGAAGAAGVSAGGGGAGAAGAAATDADPPAPRPINVTAGNVFQTSFEGQPMSVNKSKPIMGKLVLLLGGICTGTGAGGFESFVKQYGFHVFAPKTQTCVNSAPDKYKELLKTNPQDPEANRQVGDARMELWDGKDRVDWVTVNKGESIVERTVAAINAGMTLDAGGDWGYFLNADGTLRTSDVWVVGYSWGSQSWAMMSSYVRFGRVITTSGPVAEGFPNADWITHPSATPGDRKYLLVGLKSPYPSMDNGDSGDMEKFTNVMKAGWPGMPTNVMPDGMGTYTPAQHLFALIGSNGQSPGGHTVFCNDNAMNGWLPLCRYVLGIDK